MVPLQIVTGTCYLKPMSITGNKRALAETLSQQYNIPGEDWTTISCGPCCSSTFKAEARRWALKYYDPRGEKR